MRSRFGVEDEGGAFEMVDLTALANRSSSEAGPDCKDDAAVDAEKGFAAETVARIDFATVVSLLSS